MKNSLSTEPYKGTRDFYPEDMFVQKYMFRIMREAAERFGYAEYDASILEDTALYKAKTGEEIVNEQTYSFVDRGGREVTIRPEMTPTVARMVAAKRRELSFPLRWYSIPNLFRYERPQRGRLREHWQLNVDVFGIEDLEADAEVITIAHGIMTAFGATSKDFKIRLNNRRLVNAILSDHLELKEAEAYAVGKLIDRRAKMESKEFKKKLEEVMDAEKAKGLIAILGVDSLKDLPWAVQQNAGYEQLVKVSTLLGARGITNAVFDPSLMRGFDYYTGTVFEVFDTNPENSRSLFGGGRYDDLVGIFGVEKVTGVGFGMGDVTTHDFLETHKLLPEYKSPAQVYICTLGEEFYNYADMAAADLRSAGWNTAVDYTGRKLPAQIKTAERQGIAFIICIGEEEQRTGEMKIKELAKHKEYPSRREELDATLRRIAL
jgi:histidyl-tRNA synthetase